jgi:hypothetical protein
MTELHHSPSLSLEVQDYAALAKATGRKFNLYDVDAPLEVSLAGVLERVPGGNDPIPPFSEIVKGFNGVRGDREAVIDFFRANPQVGKYELFATQPNGAKIKVAEVKNGEITTFSGQEKLLKEITAKPEGIAELISQKVITEKLISDLTAQLPKERATVVANILRNYIGKTWSEAVTIHSQKR